MMKIVLNVEISNSKIKKKVLQAVSGLSGIVSMEANTIENKITVIGTTDTVEIVEKVRKILPSAYIISVGADKVEEPAEVEPDPDEPVKVEPEIEQIDWARAYNAFHSCPTNYYYCYPCEEQYNPNPCAIS